MEEGSVSLHGRQSVQEPMLPTLSNGFAGGIIQAGARNGRRQKGLPVVHVASERAH